MTLAPEVLGHLSGVPITNSLVATIVTSVVIIVGAILLTRRLRLLPSTGQTALELAVGGAFEYVQDTLGDARLARRFFPLIATIFVFIVTANLLNFIPGVGSLGFWGAGEHGGFTALFRPVNTDLNVTLALAIIAFFAIEIAGITVLGALKYGHKFVTFKSPIAFVVGIFELISELSRLVSFSFRLFGNIFAGKVILAVLLLFVPWVLPVPLLLFELMVGVIQALVFSLLTLFFIKLAVTEAH